MNGRSSSSTSPNISDSLLGPSHSFVPRYTVIVITGINLSSFVNPERNSSEVAISFPCGAFWLFPLPDCHMPWHHKTCFYRNGIVYIRLIFYSYQYHIWFAGIFDAGILKISLSFCTAMVFLSSPSAVSTSVVSLSLRFPAGWPLFLHTVYCCTGQQTWHCQQSIPLPLSLLRSILLLLFSCVSRKIWCQWGYSGTVYKVYLCCSSLIFTHGIQFIRLLTTFSAFCLHTAFQFSCCWLVNKALKTSMSFVE